MLLLDQGSFIQQIATWMCQVPQRVQGIQQRTDGDSEGQSSGDFRS